MKNDIELYELIENYLKNNLSPEEKYAFEIHISSDPELAATVEKHRQLADFIEEGTLLDIRDNILKIHNETTGSTGSGFSGKRFLYFSALAILTALIISIPFIRKSGKKEPASTTVIIPLADSNEKIKPIVKTEKESTSYSKIKLPKHMAETPDYKSDEQTESNKLQPESKAGNNNVDSDEQIVTGEKHDKIGLSDENKINLSNQVSKAEKNNQPVLADTVNCDTVQILANVKTLESCEERATGKIIVVIESAKGTIPPYSLSVDNGIKYEQTSQVVDLPPGIYPVWLKDKNNCLSIIGNFLVGSMICDYEYVFAPDKGERWEVPTKDKEGIIKIYSKQGTLVYSEIFDEGQKIEWDGNSQNGSPQPMGIYRFILEFMEGEPMIGNVTIVR